MQIAKQIAGFTPRRGRDAAQGDRQEDPRADGVAEGRSSSRAARRTTSRPSVANQLWKDMESSQDYSFNKSHAACYALIAYRTAWLKANYPCEYMAALISSVMNTKDRVPFYVNACDEMGIEVLPPDVNESADRLRRRRGQDPLRPQRGQERRRQRGARDHRGAQGGRPVHVDLGLHRARRPAGREQARARVAGQVRRARLDRRLAHGDARRARAGARLRAEARSRPARGAGLDLRPRLRRRRAEAEVARKHHPPIAGERVREGRAAAAREGDARPLRLRASAQRGARPAAPQDRRDARRARAPARRRGRHRRRHRLGGQAPDDEEGRADGVPPARGPDRLGRGRRLLGDLRDGARAVRRRPHPVVKGRVDHKQAGRDEADRARADAVRGGRRSGATCASSSTRARRRPA